MKAYFYPVNIFYCPNISQASAILDEEESRHAAKALRARSGQTLLVTDGKGRLAEAVFTVVDQRHTEIAIHSVNESPFPGPQLTLAISPLKNPDRLEWLVEKATECGVYTIVPMLCERTEKPSVNLRRLHHIALSAMKQSRRVWLPEIPGLLPFSEVVSRSAVMKLIPHCREEQSRDELSGIIPGTSTLVCIGPEGDFTENEIDLALQHGFQGISLGNYRLRAETAGMMISVWGSLSR